MTNTCNSCEIKMSNQDNTAIEFFITKEQTLLFQRYLFELEGIKALVTQFTSDSPFKPDKQIYNELLESYLEAYIRYNLLFTEMMKIYVSDDIVNNVIKNRNYESVIDFRINSINIILK